MSQPGLWTCKIALTKTQDQEEIADKHDKVDDQMPCSLALYMHLQYTANHSNIHILHLNQ